ncbi:COP9 signalosome complex subunit 3 [Aphelenchoides fujianensis]|nr:COP9 signalosome complex subunit 3 [Aphelenchoides fujianensis]
MVSAASTSTAKKPTTPEEKEGLKLLNAFAKAVNAAETDEATKKCILQSAQVTNTITSAEMDALNDKYSKVLAQFARLLIDANMAVYGIKCLQAAVRTLAKGETGVITNLHPWLFALCLSAKLVAPARPFLEVDVGRFFLTASSSYPLQTENALLFFYYGGLIKLSVYDFEGAAAMFESCVCMPAFTPSAIMIEALRKLILINALLGRPTRLPNYRSPGIQRVLHSQCNLYASCASIRTDVVQQRRAKGKVVGLGGLQSFLVRNRAVLLEEQNWGLAQLVFRSTKKAVVANLPSIFSCVSIENAAKYARVPPKEANIVELLEAFAQDAKGAVKTTIDMRAAIVRFERRAPKDREMQADVDEVQDVCAELSGLLTLCDQSLDLNVHWLTRPPRAAPGMPSTSAAGARGYSQLGASTSAGALEDDEGMQMSQ